jgi:hypothetical protein
VNKNKQSNNMKLLTITLMALTATAATSAFGVLPGARPFSPCSSSLKSKHWLDAIDEMCIENVAEYCLEGEQCEVEEKLALINQLTDQRDLMTDAAKKVDSLINRLKNDSAVINKEEKKTLESIMEAVIPEKVL